VLKFGASTETCAMLFSTGIHRCLLLNQARVITGIVCQKTLLKYVMKKLTQEQKVVVLGVNVKLNYL
jgi:CBS-domain-containing membrane protein